MLWRRSRKGSTQAVPLYSGEGSRNRSLTGSEGFIEAALERRTPRASHLPSSVDASPWSERALRVPRWGTSPRAAPARPHPTSERGQAAAGQGCVRSGATTRRRRVRDGCAQEVQRRKRRTVPLRLWPSRWGSPAGAARASPVCARRRSRERALVPRRARAGARRFVSRPGDLVAPTGGHGRPAPGLPSWTSRAGGDRANARKRHGLCSASARSGASRGLDSPPREA